MTDENQNLENTEDLNDDTLFDEPTGEENEASQEAEGQTEGNTEEGQAAEGSEETGEKENPEETPSEESKEGEDDQSGNMIPEHRFKAALKDVSDKLDAANQEIAQLKAKPAPDPDEDPDGYAFHVKMETSKEVMRASVDDYDEKIAHYQEMVKTNPYLNQAVAAHPSPAKHAYEIAKKDLELKTLSETQNSDEWKEFQEWKSNKAKDAEAAAKAAEDKKVGEQLASGGEEAKTSKKAATEVPNLNRATDVQGGKQPQVDEDEELFAGAL